MWPKEHGTYGELGFPLLTALSLGQPGLAAAALSLAIVCAYLAHEPLLVLAGVRGARKQKEQAALARRWMVGALSLSLVFGAIGAFFAAAAARWALLVPCALALAVLPLAFSGKERTLVGELLAGAALVSASLPVALSSGMALEVAIGFVGVWLLSFALLTGAVRGVARKRWDGGRRLRVAAAVALGVGVVVSALAFWGGIEGWLAQALIPTWLTAAIVVSLAPSPRHMHRVGWSLIASSALTYVALLWLVPN
ncbi:MAG: YwiC-like family protein [Myxococcales bacterium]|nr:YwiC-like family protein [Myxococcales bacterium]